MEPLYDQIGPNVKAREKYIIISAVLPLLKLLSLTVFGIILAHPKTQLVPKATFRLLSKLVFALFLPCTIFIYLGKAISLKNFTLWWFIPVNVLVSTAIGSLLGILVAIICRPPPELYRFTVIVTAFGNTGNLPLAIVGSVCHSKENPFGGDCNGTGEAYVSFAQWVSVLLVYTLVYHMMEPPVDHYEVVEDEDTEIQEQLASNDLSRPLLVEAEWPGMEEHETENCKAPIIARAFTSGSSISESTLSDLNDGEPRSPKSIRCFAEPGVVRRIRVVAEQTPVKNILQPPMIATLLAFIAGMVPPIKSVVYGNDVALSFITDSLDMMAAPLVPAVMLILGGMLAEGRGSKESRLGIRTTIGVIVARLLVLPLIGILIVSLADKLNFLIPRDNMYRFVLLLQYTTPSAILFGAVASLRGYAISEASAMLFWQHVCALFSISLYIIVYFKLLLSYELFFVKT